MQEAQNTEVKFAVFRDEQGNRFVFPSIFDDGEKSIDWAQCMSLRLALNIEEEKERLVVPVEDGEFRFSHVRSEALHRSFMHGAATVYLISGPTFDEISSEQSAH